jgi:hypothetical protein
MGPTPKIGKRDLWVIAFRRGRAEFRNGRIKTSTRKIRLTARARNHPPFHDANAELVGALIPPLSRSWIGLQIQFWTRQSPFASQPDMFPRQVVRGATAFLILFGGA